MIEARWRRGAPRGRTVAAQMNWILRDPDGLDEYTHYAYMITLRIPK
jgi:hypothetical protein